jgi:hypothetical protein
MSSKAKAITQIVTKDEKPKPKEREPEEILVSDDIKTSNSLSRQSTSGYVLNYFNSLFKDVTRLSHLILIFMLSITVLFVLGLYNILQRLETLENRTIDNQTKSISKSSDTLKSYKNSLEITEFAGNKGVVDFGSKVRVEKNTIETIDSPNCKISTLPPLNNNCFLTFSPSLTGLAKATTIFTGISFEGALDGDNLLNLDIIDNLKDEAVGQKLLVDKTNFTQINLLPLNVSPNYSVRMTFWQRGDIIKISKIKLHYLSIGEMVAVSGKVNGLSEGQNYTTVVFLDTDQDKKLSKVDTEWKCTQFYPGVSKTQIQSDGTFTLVRDSGCYTKTKPEKWSQDAGLAALPIGNWLFVIYDKDSNPQTFYFNIESVDKPVNLEFQYLKS